MSLIKDAVDFLLPAACSVCGRFPDADGKLPCDVPQGFHICFNCLSGIIPQPEDKRFFPCMSEPFDGDPVPGLLLYMPYPYRGFFEKAVPRIKFHSKPELASFSGMLLGNLMKKDGIKADLSVPVPLSETRLKERGYNQASLIAHEASKVCGIPCVDGILMRTRDTLRQTEITDNAERSRNVTGAFKVAEDFVADGLKILLFDDVATTGNTLHEAATALYEAGASKVLCVALAGNRAVLNAESC